VIKVKVKVKCHVIRALLCWQENRFFCQANDRIKASILQSNISSISVTFARWKHHCGRSLLSTIALFLFISTTHLMLIKGRLACMCTWSIGLTFKSRLEIGISIKLRVLLARNLQEVAILLANLLYAQANSVSYPRLGRKWVVGLAFGLRGEGLQGESKTFDDIFAWAESFCIKFRTFIGNLYPHTSTDFRLFIHICVPIFVYLF